MYHVLISLALVAGIFPNIPGLGGDLPVKAAAKQLAPYFAQNQPVIRDWNAIYPTAPSLPGAPFAPTTSVSKQASIESSAIAQIRKSKGDVKLAAGDYAIPVRVFCTDIHRHAKSPELYLLGPLKGSRADLLTTMYSHASGTNIGFGSIQPLSWSLQAGMKYEELPQSQQHTYDQLMPGGRGLIASSFLELLQSRWSTISGTVPGVPSFDSAIGQMGDLGNAINDLRYGREQILANANSFDAMRNALVPGGLQAGGSGTASPWDAPWSIVSDGVYMRLITMGAYGSAGILEVRTNGGQIPITSSIGYARECHDCQPLTMHILKGAQPQPALGQKVGVFD